MLGYKAKSFILTHKKKILQLLSLGPYCDATDPCSNLP